MPVLDDRTMAPEFAAPTQDLPPPLDLELNDGDRHIGHIRGNLIRFHGFADPTEAAHAAWVAWRVVNRRLARQLGERPVHIDVQPLTIVRAAGAWRVTASGEPFATLVVPEDPLAPDETSIAFELAIPVPPDELTMRSLARLAYRTLRKSGVQWALMRPARQPDTHAARTAGERSEHTAARTAADARASRPASPLKSLLGSIAIVAVLVGVGLRLLAGRPSAIYIPGTMAIAVVGTITLVWGARHYLSDEPVAAAAPTGEGA